MPLALITKKQAQELVKQKVEVFYEEWSKAMYRGINGYPMFVSLRSLTRDDYNLVVDEYNKLKAALDAVT